MLLATIVAGNALISSDRSVSASMLGHDFLPLYTAGALARQGQSHLLYDLRALRELEHSIAAMNGLEIGAGFGPFWNPPFYAWVTAPLSKLGYPRALGAWMIFNAICLVVALIVLARMLPAITARPPKFIMRLADEPIPVRFKRDWRNWALVPLLVCGSMPFIQAAGHGQNTFCSLMLLALAVSAWRARMPVAAGLACGLLFYKPQLAAVVAAMLIFSMGIRVCLGLGFVAGMLVLLTGTTMPDAIGDYLHQLPLNLKVIQIDQPYLWERHVTLEAFFRLLLQGRDAGELSSTASAMTTALSVLIGAGLVGGWWRSRRPGLDDVWTGETRSLARDRLIGATITAMPLLMPFYFDYDLLMLSIPAVLLGAEIVARPPGARLGRTDRALVGGWIALYLWLMVNPPVAAATGVNLTVVLLGAVCGLSIVRVWRRGVRASTLLLPQVQRVTVRRAA